MITIIAVLCSLQTGVCKDHMVTNSDWDPNLTMTGCLVGAPAVVEWAKAFPQYKLQRWRCQLGVPAKEKA